MKGYKLRWRDGDERHLKTTNSSIVPFVFDPSFSILPTSGHSRIHNYPRTFFRMPQYFTFHVANFMWPTKQQQHHTSTRVFRINRFVAGGRMMIVAKFAVNFAVRSLCVFLFHPRGRALLLLCSFSSSLFGSKTFSRSQPLVWTVVVVVVVGGCFANICKLGIPPGPPPGPDTPRERCPTAAAANAPTPPTSSAKGSRCVLRCF